MHRREDGIGVFRCSDDVSRASARDVAAEFDIRGAFAGHEDKTGQREARREACIREGVAKRAIFT